jgi:arylsulfatase A-like enzyme
MKGPFMYDELLNVPLVISYPKRFMNPVVTDSLVSLVDLVPTLCAMTGVRWPAPLSGVDLSPVMQDPASECRTEIFAEYHGKQQWKCPIRTIRTVQWKYNFSISGEEELYDLESDPGELHNLSKSAEHTQTRLALSKQLHAWREKTRDPLL